VTKEFDKVNKKIIRQFSKDRNLALATSVNDMPYIRIIDAYYHEASFYIVTYNHSEKMKQIEKNKNVSLCTNLFEFQGRATNIGHPLDENNKVIRELLVDAFSNWYFEHNDESDARMSFVKVELDTAFVYFNKIGYKIDFNDKSVESFPFDHKQQII